MLVLFDIDGTLLHARGAGVRSMEQVGRRLFHPGFSMEGIAFAGRLDPLIWQDAAAANGIADAEAREAEFRRAYAEAYADAVAAGHATATLLPGVAELLAALAEAEIACGIVTGNYPETGRLKIIGAGLEPARFVAAAWGSDGRHRRDLPPVAIERHARTSGRPIDAASVLVVGDTPHDVDCARHAGCRSLAVGTGPSFTRAEIEASGPDHFVADLGDTDLVLGLITELLGGGESMTAGPIETGDRIAALDVLRGVALLGIVMVNVFSFGLPLQEAFSRPPVADPVEDAGFLVMRSLFQFKWMPVFSMLFGAGLAVQVARAAARGEGFVGRYLRRTGVLLVVGLIHAWLLWYGDILVWYAVLGVGLLAVRRTPPRTLLVAGAVLLVVGGLLGGGLGMAATATSGGAEAAVVDASPDSGPRGWDAITAAQFDPSRPEWIQGERVAYASGPWGDAAAFRIVSWLYGLALLVLGWGFIAFGCFLLGAGLLRSGFFAPERRRLQGRVAAICLGIGLPAEILGGVLVLGGGLPAMVAELVHGLTGPLAAVGLLAGITWLVSTGRTAAWDAPVRAAGRAALSVYLGQTILGLMVFQWWGLGLFAAVPRPVMLLIALAIWLVLAAAATLWLARFRFGPVEWVWRTATYGRWQPLRRRDAAAG